MVDAEMLKNVVAHSVATALARNDLPVPGGPYRRIPRHGLRLPYSDSGESVSKRPTAAAGSPVQTQSREGRERVRETEKEKEEGQRKARCRAVQDEERDVHLEELRELDRENDCLLQRFLRHFQARYVIPAHVRAYSTTVSTLSQPHRCLGGATSQQHQCFPTAT